MLIKHENLNLVAGLDWSLYDTDAQAKAFVKEHVKENGKTPYLLTSHQEQSLLGLYSSDELKNGYYAAAALLGLVQDNLLINHSLDDSHTWICLIQGGKPVPGFDRVVSSEEARALFTEASSVSSGTYVGNISGAHYSLDDLLATAVQKINDGSIGKKALRDALLQRPGVSAKAVATLVVIGSLPILGMFGWQAYQAQLRSAEGRALTLKELTQTQEAARQAEQLRQQKITEFQKSVAVRREQFQIAPGTLLAQWTACEAVRGALPLTQWGYRPTQLHCDFEKRTATVTWSASNSTKAVNFADKARLPGIQDADRFTPSAQTQVPLNIEAVPHDGPAAQFTDVKHLQNSLFGAMGARSRNFVLEPPAPVVMTAAPELKQPPVSLGDEGKWRDAISGTGTIVQAAGVARILAAWPVRLQSVRWSELSGATRSVGFEGAYTYAVSN